MWFLLNTVSSTVFITFFMGIDHLKIVELLPILEPTHYAQRRAHLMTVFPRVGTQYHRWPSLLRVSHNLSQRVFNFLFNSHFLFLREIASSDLL